MGSTLVAMAMIFRLKSPIIRLVWQIDRRRFGLTEFSGKADSMEPYKMLWGRPPTLVWTFGLGSEI